MSISPQLGPQHRVRIPAGAIDYRETGDGPPIVFVHGVAVNGDLWRHVAPPLAAHHRCITPDLPWGSHSAALEPDVDLSLPGMARIVADFIAALGLEDVTIVANDTGGAVAQALVGAYPQRIARLVLTSCDALEKFPPTPQKYLEVMARSRLLTWIVAYTAQFRFVQRLPTAYGYVTSAPLPAEIMESYTGPIRRNPGVRRDFQRMLRAVDTRFTFEAAAALPGFDKPALVLWGERDKIFPREHGRRLAELLPQARFDLIAGSRTFIPEEQPQRLVSAIEDFLAAHPIATE
ncbi:alpha/beta fold hydrolase [Mycobacterium sp. shizuoka-1]|uniref:alpha/beta fold hydrolase n=1 Tax=Mycobacterium sp. shizuoka-1 TaxID=2039281 RepID=UPI000C06674A|nr:alpha/beta hydrolase [Mycobacterium sp. shizuoka-1]GAY16243.1 alpha/beta hydrolase [Mycobacterium sp. shizuoka-1]